MERNDLLLALISHGNEYCWKTNDKADGSSVLPTLVILIMTFETLFIQTFNL